MTDTPTNLKAIRSQHDADAAMCKANGFVPSLSHKHRGELLALLDEAMKFLQAQYHELRAWQRQNYSEAMVDKKSAQVRNFLAKLED